MKNCMEKCMSDDRFCSEEKCRAWINYEEDLNCSNIAIAHNGDMTLAQIANRLKLSIVRIKQIQDKALQKLQKKRHLKAF